MEKNIRGQVEKSNNTKSAFNFRKSMKNIVAATIVAAGTVGGTLAIRQGYLDNQPMDLSTYNIDEDQIMKYVDKEDMNLMNNMNDYVRIYKMLSKGNLTESQKEELKDAKSGIARIISSGRLSKIYLNDILKEKVKEASGAKEVKVVAPESKDAVGNFWIELKDKNGKSNSIEKDEMCNPVKSVIKNIISLQYIEDYSEISDKDIEKIADMHMTMEGFANLTLIQDKDGKLAYMEFGEAEKHDMVQEDNEK